MVTNETQHIQVVITNSESHLKREIKSENVGFLRMEPTYIHCVACQHEGLSTMRLEQVTCMQRFVAFTRMCKSWSGLNDINHYCSKCGCYIGRYIVVGCSERCISKCARRKAATGDITLRAKTKNCSERISDSVKERQAKKRAEKESKMIAAKIKDDLKK